MFLRFSLRFTAEDMLWRGRPAKLDLGMCGRERRRERCEMCVNVMGLQRWGGVFGTMLVLKRGLGEQTFTL